MLPICQALPPHGLILLIKLAENAFAPATLSVPEPTQECAFALHSASNNAATSNIPTLAIARQHRKVLEHERSWNGKHVVAMALAPDQARAIISIDKGGTWPSSAITSGTEENTSFPPRRDRLDVLDVQRDTLGLRDSCVLTRPDLALRRCHGRRAADHHSLQASQHLVEPMQGAVGEVGLPSGAPSTVPAVRAGGPRASAIIHDQRHGRVPAPRRHPIHARPRVSWSWHQTAAVSGLDWRHT